MKTVLYILIGVLIVSCTQNKKESSKTENSSMEISETSENFDWLLGKWKRLNEEEGKETFENWLKDDNSSYSGIGFTMQNGDTIWQEEIRLSKTNGKWNLTVKLSEELESTIFYGVSHSENEFQCENHEIDFPNKIKYWKNGNNLNASVSNQEMEISFEFEKIASP